MGISNDPDEQSHAGDVRKEREAYDQQLRQREEERIRQQEEQETKQALQQAQVDNAPVVPGASRSTFTVRMPVSQPQQATRSAVSPAGLQANWTMPGTQKTEPAQQSFNTVEDAVVNQMDNVHIDYGEGSNASLIAGLNFGSTLKPRSCCLFLASERR